jgi:hypothetical protein
MPLSRKCLLFLSTGGEEGQGLGRVSCFVPGLLILLNVRFAVWRLPLHAGMINWTVYFIVASLSRSRLENLSLSPSSRRPLVDGAVVRLNQLPGALFITQWEF